MSTNEKDQMSVNEAGKKGGDATAASHDKEFYQENGSKGGQNSGGNFKKDPERAAEAGSKGGQHSGDNFANDREKASEAGRKGGENSHGGGRNN
ncbi:general stress protein [Pseudomonas phytophila]|uniref:General stress protein n=1 Tax=Pseudomonas phytophila TaxID=2867264 RepID=A0ABY6F7M8_9PSED|nr:MULTISPECIES: general stress protein [Pseudomonas]MCD5986293.1 general stress protein [Pseudomonas quasicaspiana]UXZ93883.1 general stress protein [Pseudomonas phytophila]